MDITLRDNLYIGVKILDQEALKQNRGLDNKTAFHFSFIIIVYLFIYYYTIFKLLIDRGF